MQPLEEDGDMYIFVIAGTIVSGLISILIICGVLYSVYNETKPAEILIQWGGIIIGFYFGTFVTLVKDIIPRSQSKKIPTERSQAPKTKPSLQ